nr:diguanylate cyclase [Halomonas socia]
MKKTHHNALTTNLNLLISGTIFALAIGPITTSMLKQRSFSEAGAIGSPSLEIIFSCAFLGGVVLVLVAIVRPLFRAYQAREETLRTLEREQKKLEDRNRQLAHQACTDGLLGITNRRELERLLALEWKRANREQQPLALLLIDVDHFKHYNDSYGHLQGDACLKRLAQALQQSTGRPCDVVARFGGEEFAILLPNTKLNGGLEVAKRVHENLSCHAIAFPNSPCSAFVTVSIGAASMTPELLDCGHDLIQRADKALYAAKYNGRNRTECFQPPSLVSTSCIGKMSPKPQHLASSGKSQRIA